MKINKPIKQFLFRQFKKNETKIHELNYLFWECTTRCNLSCLHCGSDCSKDSLHQDMPLEDFLKAVDTIENPAEHFIIVVTGGEPLLRKDIEACGREFRKRGLRWGMVTNGFLYNKEKHISLLNAGLGSLTISVDGLGESHNYLRNNSRSFERVDKAIELAASSTRLNFDVVTCVHQGNIGELHQIKDYLIRKGVKAWRLFTIAPIGRAKENPLLFLTKPQFRELMDFIRESRREKRIKVSFSCEGYVGEYEWEVRDSGFFCRAGINIGSVLIDGSISACPNIDRSFAQGNIYQDNLFEIWQTKFGAFRNRSWTKKGKCKDCKEYKNCEGNGLHYWHGGMEEVAVCHKEQGELIR
ncbi:TIGR04133 family radical SAM/SPASM protein [Bacteroides sp. 224]|uniref:TIGR04133 family radical SAM/SPASM protein n=1 Tax=Bacteroides sp. 224 TaxID=2302936 RepID=UPI0013CFD27B|nr:TIGR04133 family radical SAM/SPASM protein [Bacteroides sp. 224]NDV64166.1 radical SAM protein [Bacteroides sp. 224]